MDTGLVIHIGWEYFLGIMASLIGVAWYSGSRFSAIETSIKWLESAVREMKLNADNANNRPAFQTQSPINLTQLGQDWLKESGLKDFIDSRKGFFIEHCESQKNTNPYEVQKQSFKVLDEFIFDSATEDSLKRFAYEKGTTMALLRRIGGIYVRNLCLEKFGMKKEEIDQHDPAKTSHIDAK